MCGVRSGKRMGAKGVGLKLQQVQARLLPLLLSPESIPLPRALGSHAIPPYAASHAPLVPPLAADWESARSGPTLPPPALGFRCRGCGIVLCAACAPYYGSLANWKERPLSPPPPEPHNSVHAMPRHARLTAGPRGTVRHGVLALSRWHCHTACQPWGAPAKYCTVQRHQVSEARAPSAE